MQLPSSGQTSGFAGARWPHSLTKTVAKRKQRPATAELPFRYVETSELRAAVLEQDDAAREALRGDAIYFTSGLTVAKAQRALIRARTTSRLSARDEQVAAKAIRAFLRRCHVVGLAAEILERAGESFPVEPIRTADALHLATLEYLEIPPHVVTVISRDERVRANAHALGYALA